MTLWNGDYAGGRPPRRRVRPVLPGTPVPAEEPDGSGEQQERTDQDERGENLGHDACHFVRAAVTVVTA